MPAGRAGSAQGGTVAVTVPPDARPVPSMRRPGFRTLLIDLRRLAMSASPPP